MNSGATKISAVASARPRYMMLVKNMKVALIHSVPRSRCARGR